MRFLNSSHRFFITPHRVMWVATLGLILGGLLIAITFFGENSIEGELLYEYGAEMFLTGLSIGLVSLFTLFIVSDMRVYIRANTLFLDRQTGEIIIHYAGPAVWDWDQPYRKYHRIVLDDESVSANVRMSVSPITANPKVRKILYLVQVSAKPATLEAFEVLRRWVGNVLRNPIHWVERHDLDRRIRYDLYEFNDKHSSEVAEFFNPLDESQQDRFSALVHRFLSKRLPDCVAVESIRFGLE